MSTDDDHGAAHGAASQTRATRPPLWLGLVAAGILLAGCAQARKFTPDVDPAGFNDTQFVHYLATVPVVTYEEACRAFVIAADGEDRFGSHDEREQSLAERGIVRRAWGLKSGDIVDMGTLSHMMARTCGLRPSVDSVLFGLWGLGDRRYAHREVIYAGMLEQAPTYKPVSGGEFVSALAKTDEYMARHGQYEMGADVDSPSDVQQ